MMILNEDMYGASLTTRLREERETILFELARREKSLRLLFESSGNPHLAEVALQLELIQLNEFIAPHSKLLRSTGLDLRGRIIERTVTEIQEYYNLTDAEADLLREGFWDSVQAGIGSFAGGADKILKKIGIKKEPEGYEQAQAIFKKVAEDEANTVIRDLVAKINDETENQEADLGVGKSGQQFPVNKHSEVFQSGVNTVASVYDSIVDAYKNKEEGDDGYLPVEAVNEIIQQLRIVVQKYMTDTEREKGGMYVSFGGGSGNTDEGDAYEGAQVLDEADDEAGDIDPDKEYEKIMRGQESPVFKRMSSMKAPAVIAAGGLAVGAMAFLANQPWFQDLVVKLLGLEGPAPAPQMEEMIVSQPQFTNLGDVQSGEGITQFFSRTVGADLGPNASTDDFLAVAKKVGGGNLDQGLQTIAGMTEGTGDPEAALSALRGLAESGESMKIGNFFKKATEVSGVGGTIFAIPTGPVIAKSITKKIIKGVVKQGAKTAVGTGAGAAVAFMTGAAPVLAGLGISAVVAGAALAGIRHRAKKKSRMGVLQDLLGMLNEIEPKPVTVGPAQDDVTVDIVLKNESYSLASALFGEQTTVKAAGISGLDPEGKALFDLEPVPLDKVPFGVKDLEPIPDIRKGIEAALDGLDLDSDSVTVTVDDQRKEDDDGPIDPPVKPPVPVKPAQIAKGQHAVCVFTEKDGAEVWRILKKVTYRKYASDAKKSGDEDAPKFLERYKNYDSILDQLRADGVFVDTPELEKELTKISSGPQGDQYKATYTRTRKGKDGKPTRKKSVTGGYTEAGDVADITAIRANIKGAGGRRPRGVNDFTVIYLVGQDVLEAVKSAGADEEEAKTIIMNALGKWSTDEKRPKLKDLGIADDDEGKAIGDALKKASLAEQRRRMSVIGIKQFSKMLRENHTSKELERWQTLAGIR